MDRRHCWLTCHSQLIAPDGDGVTWGGTHSVRKPLVISRKVTQGRNAHSDPLFVAGMSWLVTKTHMWRQIFLITQLCYSSNIGGVSSSNPGRF